MSLKPTRRDRILSPVRVLGADPLVLEGQVGKLVCVPGTSLVAAQIPKGVMWLDVSTGLRAGQVSLAHPLLAAAPAPDHVLLVDPSGGLRLARLDGRIETVVRWDAEGGSPSDTVATEDGARVVVAEQTWFPDQQHWIRIVDTARATARRIETAPRTARIAALAISADGSRLAATLVPPDIDAVPYVTVWDADSGEPVAHLALDPPWALAPTEGIALSADGGLLASGTRLFDIARGGWRATGGSDEPRMRRVAFSRDGRHLLGLHVEGLVSYAVETGRQVGHTIDNLPPQALALSENAVILSDSHALRILDWPSLNARFVHADHAGPVLALAVATGGEQVFSGRMQTLVAWHGDAQRACREDFAFSLALSPDGGSLLAAGHCAELLCADTLEPLEDPGPRASAVAWPEPERPVALTYEEAPSETDDRLACEVQVAAGLPLVPIARARSPYIGCMPALSGDGRTAVLWEDRRVWGWNLERPGPLWERPSRISGAALDRRGEVAAILVLGEPWVLLLDGQTGEVLGRCELPAQARVRGVLAWTAGGQLAVATEDHSVWVFEAPLSGAASPRTRCWLQADCSALATCPEGRWLAAGCTDGRIALFDLAGPATDASKVEAEELFAQLTTPDARLRERAVYCLGLRAEHRPRLAALAPLQSEPAVLVALIRMLRREDGAEPLLQGWLRHDEVAVAAAAARALALRAGLPPRYARPGNADELAAWTELWALARDPARRNEAETRLRALAPFGDEWMMLRECLCADANGVQRFRAWLADPEPGPRLAAVLSLASDPASAGPLERMLWTDPDPHVRHHAASALSSYVLDVVLAADYPGGAVEGARASAAQILVGRSPMPATLAYLLEDRDPLVREAYIEATRRAPDSAQRLAWSARQGKVRSRAVRALASGSDEEVGRAIRTMAHDPEGRPHLRGLLAADRPPPAAIQALRDDAASVERIAALCGHADRRVSNTARQVVHERRAEQIRGFARDPTRHEELVAWLGTEHTEDALAALGFDPELP